MPLEVLRVGDCELESLPRKRGPDISVPVPKLPTTNQGLPKFDAVLSGPRIVSMVERHLRCPVNRPARRPLQAKEKS